MKDHSVYVEEPDVVELKACPFCGGTDIATDRDGNEFPVVVVFCRNCGANMSDDTDHTSTDWPWDRWNTRASTPPVTVDDVELAMITFATKACELTGEDPASALASIKADTDERRVFEKCFRAALEAIRNRKGDDRG